MQQSFDSSLELSPISSPVEESSHSPPSKISKSNDLAAEKKLKLEEMLDELQEFRVINSIIKAGGDDPFLYRCMICEQNMHLLQVVAHVTGNKHLGKRIAQRKAAQSGGHEVVERPKTVQIKPSTSSKTSISQREAKKVKFQAMLDEPTPLMEANQIVKERTGDESTYRCGLCGVAVTLPVVQLHIKGRIHRRNQSEQSKQVKRWSDENEMENNKRAKTCND